MVWIRSWLAVLLSLTLAVTAISAAGKAGADVQVEQPDTATIEAMRGFKRFDISVPSQIIRLTGTIAMKDVEAVEQALAKMPKQRGYREHREVLVLLDSPGGSFAAGIKIARILDRHKVPTFVPAGAECLSACAVIFMAGTEQFLGGEAAENRAREIEMPARLGFHRPFIAEFAAAISPSVIEFLGPEELQALFAEEFLLAFETANELIQDMLAVDPQAWNTDLLLQMLTATRTAGGNAFVYLETVDDALAWGIDMINVVPPPVRDKSARFDTAFALCYNYGRRVDAEALKFWPPIEQLDQEYAYNKDPGPQGAYGETFSENGRKIQILWYHEGLVGCTVRFSETGEEVTISAGQFGENDPTRTFEFSKTMTDRLWGHDPRAQLTRLAVAASASASANGRCMVLDGRRVIDDDPCRRESRYTADRESVDTYIWPSGSKTVVQEKGAWRRLNGQRTERVEPLPDRMSFCLKNLATKRTFCFGPT